MEEGEGRGVHLKNEYELIAVDLEMCMHCGACVGTCPSHALTLHDLSIAADGNCTGCGTCIRVCPVGAIEKCDEGG